MSCGTCYGRGTVITCIDDMCRNSDSCMHGDGEKPCPDCDDGTPYDDEPFEQPTMNCPKCGKEYEDFDGVGVVYCAPPEGCGFCQHLSRDGQERDGKLVMVCGFCGKVDDE